ncbi:MAG: alpha/beta hydrolase [Rhodobacteraceae bacterium]|nr:alpha/beta hydrolase [Paracoccaceae bacterium]
MEYLLANGRQIAYRKTEGDGPGVLFLGGFRSDMEGTKAVFLENWAKRAGRAFLRFDYSGHGGSSEEFTDGCIGDWSDDAIAVLDELTKGPQVLVGSSMGGWISLLCARARPKRVAGLVGVASAPDFTEDSMWNGFLESQKNELRRTGQVELPSGYDDEPYVITQKLIEDGREQLVLREPLDLPFPVRLLHGTADVDVEMSVPLRIVGHVTCEDLRLTFVKGADHRFSDGPCLEMIVSAVKELTE